MHSADSGAFTDESEEVGLLFAAHAAIAMVGAQEQAQLAAAVNSRDLIGQAKGILMERYKISADEAFMMLVVASQSTNIRVVDVAEQLISTGLLASREPHPGPPSGHNVRISASPASHTEAATVE